MKNVSRFVLFLTGGIVALFAVALLSVNLYVQSQTTQKRIQEELSQRLGTTLHIRRISVTPWWGLKLTGITMPQVEAGAPGDFLQAETFRLRIRFASLFSGRLVIKEVALVSPKVRWTQNADGKWRLPMEKRVVEQPPAEPAAPLAAPPAASEPVASSSVPSASAPEPAEAQEEPFTPEVRRVALSDGSFHFLDRKGRPVATFEGVAFRSNFRSTAELRGNARIRKVSLRDRFFLQDLKSPLRYDAEELELSQISARAGGGEIGGEFLMLQSQTESPFVAKVVFRNVQVDRVVTEAGGPAGMLQGRIEGNLNASGKTADPNALAGSGEIYLRDGEVRKYPVLVALGQVLQIEELSQLRLEQAQVKYHIMPGVVMIDELLLTSPNIRLSSRGTVDFNGKLQLESQLAIKNAIREQLFRPVRNNFQPIGEPGYSAVNFHVTGTVSHPKTDLMGKLIGPELKDLTSLISTFLGGEKSEKRAKKKPNESASAPAEPPAAEPARAPEPSPSPASSP